MATDAPEPREVSDFRFRQLRKFKLAKDNENVPARATNLVATSSKYGLMFVGVENGFKVLKLENILDLSEDKENIRNHAENYSSQKVTCDVPVLLSVSADDLTLAVCVQRNSSAVADMYDLRVFADPDETPFPFLSVQLSSNGAQLKDFSWNPVVVEMYVFLLSDGSVHVHELVETALKIVASQPMLQATAVCWSPKGKQLVVGKNDGSFSQFKPTLQEVKSIAPPKLDENALAVSSLCWLSTTLFAVLYVPADSRDESPFLVFVSTPKGSPITYTNYYDVCFGSGLAAESRYLMHYESEWGLLICTSTNSPDVAVIGISKTNPSIWEQWKLDEGAEAMLPTDKTGESYPLGLGVMYCAQRKIVISDNETYPAMPIIFILSTKGLLVPFHMHNSAPGCANLVFPSEPIFTDGIRRCKDPPPVKTETPQMLKQAAISQTVLKPFQPQAEITNQAPSISQSSMFNMSALKQNSMNQAPIIQSPISQAPIIQSPISQAPIIQSPISQAPIMHSPIGQAPIMHSPIGQAPIMQSPVGQAPIVQSPISQAPIIQSPISQVPRSVPFGYSQSQIPSFSSLAPTQPSLTSTQPVTPTFITPPQKNIPQQMSPFQNIAPILTPASIQPQSPFFTSPAQMPPQSGFMISPDNSEKVHKKPSRESSLSVISPPTSVESPGSMRPVAVAQRHLASVKKVEIKTDKVNTYVGAIFEEMNSMNSEIEDLKSTLSQSFHIGTNEEMACLKQSTLLFQEFQTNMKNTMKSLNSDIHNLKDVLLESFVMVEDANSRERRKNDNSYISMLKNRALDPMTAKRMQKIDQHYHYVSTQLQEVHDKLDHNYREFEDKRKENQKARHPIPSIEAIYRAIVNNQKTVYNLRNKTDQLVEIAKSKKLNNISRRPYNRFMQKELSKLADSLLQSKISTPNDENSEEAQVTKKLSSDKQAVLCEFLANRVVSTIKPTVVYTPSQSRLLSRSLLYAKDDKQVKQNTNHTSVLPENLSGNTRQVSLSSQNKSQSAFGSPSQSLIARGAATRNALPTQIQERQLKPENTFSAITQTFPSKISLDKSSAPPALIVPVTKAATPQNASQRNLLSNQAPIQVSGSFQSVAMSTPLNSGMVAKNATFNQAHAFSFIQSREESQPSFVKGPESYYEDITPTATPPYSEDDYSGETSHLSEEEFKDFVSSSRNNLSLYEPVNLQQSPKDNIFEVSINKEGEPAFQISTSTTQSYLPPNSLQAFSSQAATNVMVQNYVNSQNREIAKNSTDSLPSYSQAISSNSNPQVIISSNSNVPLPEVTPDISITVMNKPAAGESKLEVKVEQNKDSTNSFPSFGQSSKPLFGEKFVFGNPDPNAKSFFGSSTTTTSSFFGGFKPSTTAPSSTSVFGQKLGSTSVFGQTVTTDVSKIDSSTKSIASTTTVVSPSSPSLFGQVSSNNSISAPIFGPLSTSGSLLFTKPESSVQPQTTISLPSTVVTSSSIQPIITQTVSLASKTDAGSETHSQDSVQSPTSPVQSIITSAVATGVAEALTSQSTIETLSGQITITPISITTLQQPTATTTVVVVQTPTTPAVTSAEQLTVTSAEQLQLTPTKVSAEQPRVTSTASSTVQPPVTSTTASVEQSSESSSTVSAEQPTVPVSAAPEPTATTTVTVGFGQTAVAPVFGQAAVPLYGGQTTDSAVTSPSVFGQPDSTTSANVFGQVASTTSVEAANAAPKSPFQQTPVTAASVFGAANSTTTSVFGQKTNATTSSFFGQPAATTQSSFFTKTTGETPAFGQISFTQSTTTAAGPFGQGSFFSQTTVGGTSVFGGTPPNADASVFGGQSAASGFSFGKSTFGQNTGSSFGLAKAVFGSNSTFGQQATPAQPSFGQTQTGGGVFGQGSFFSGLGGKPSAENASKNVFGSAILSKSSGDTGIFGSEGASTFGSKPAGSFSGGSFSTGSGSVGETGFGSFQQSPQKPGGFGTAPAFGSSASFGSPPAFGGMAAPSSPLTGGSLFGSQQQNANFSNFAAASSPTFGSLAMQTAGSFGSPPPAQQQTFGQQQSSVFASAPVFGSSFGGQQQSSFGNPGSPSNTSAFTQWRN